MISDALFNNSFISMNSISVLGHFRLVKSLFTSKMSKNPIMSETITAVIYFLAANDQHTVCISQFQRVQSTRGNRFCCLVFVFLSTRSPC